jgi:hypothetical protein
MNTYEHYECFSKCGGGRKKITRFFSFGQSRPPFFGSQVFISFINSIMRSVLVNFVFVCVQTTTKFMNIMNTYEVRVCKRFFGNMRSVRGDFMNLKRWSTSQVFINWRFV